MQNKKVLGISIVILLVLFLGVSYIYKNQQSQAVLLNAKVNNSALVREHSIVIGNEKAKVELVEFFDPACETCAMFHPLVKEIMKENEGNIKLVLRYAPFHAGSADVVRMLEATRKQGQFMKTLDLVFLTQRIWTINHTADLNKLWGVLIQSGHLDMDKLVDDMKNPEIDKIIKQDLADAKVLEANKTPSYFVNGKPLEVFSLEHLKALIKSEL
ncbi:MAG: DsbA family protein [Poseidonibacter sp.]|uniref:DsbA family protein n=2 Tax=Poseidonibacter sp. TaxID=2321188 RepID=UPI00359DEAB6